MSAQPAPGANDFTDTLTVNQWQYLFDLGHIPLDRMTRSQREHAAYFEAVLKKELWVRKEVRS